MRVVVTVQGLTPGLHGIHIHAVASCTAPTFADAGGHYNPLGHEHGLENPDGPHAGDLPNLVVDADGHGHLNATTDRVTLTDGPASLFDLDGSAFIIHANPDDQVTERRQRRERCPHRVRGRRAGLMAYRRRMNGLVR